MAYDSCFFGWQGKARGSCLAQPCSQPGAPASGVSLPRVVPARGLLCVVERLLSGTRRMCPLSESSNDCVGLQVSGLKVERSATLGSAQCPVFATAVIRPPNLNARSQSEAVGRPRLSEHLLLADLGRSQTQLI